MEFKKSSRPQFLDGDEFLRLQRALNINEWEVQSFLFFILIVQVVFSFVQALNLIGFQLPVFSQVISVGYLIFVPGAVFLRALNFNAQSIVEVILYIVGLSLAFIMMLGALLNAVGSFFALGLVSTFPLLIAISAIVLALTAIIYLRDGSISKPVSIEAVSQFSLKSLVICVLPLLSILGTFFMNSYGVNTILLLMLFVLSIVPTIVTFNKIPPKLYPLLIFSISLSLVYFNSLITNNLSGWDIHLEYYFADLVKTNSYWNTTLPSDYNAMLSVVMIGPIFSDIGGLSLVWVFKIIYPLLFSIVPVALYELFKKRTNETTAFLSSFFLMATYVFYSEMVQLARQEIASIFLVLLFFLIIDGKLKSTKPRILFIIFGFALVISHYALTYLFLFSAICVLLLLAFLQSTTIQLMGDRILSKIKKAQSPEKPKPVVPRETFFVPKILILFLILCTFAWYFFVASSTSLTSLTEVLSNISNATSTGFFNPSTSQGLSLVASSASTPLHAVNQVLYLLLELFIIVGFATLIVRARVGNFSRTYICFAFVSLIIAFACISVPYFSDALNASRLYLFTLIFLAPLGIIGGGFLIQILGKIFRIKIKSKIAIKIMAGLLGLFLLFNSGFMYEVTKDDPTMMALNNTIDYPRFSDGEVQAAKWIANQVKTEPVNTTVTVYGDIYGSLLLKEFLWDVKTFWGDTTNVADNATVYIYFRSVNVKGQVMASWPISSYVNIQNCSFGNIVARAVKVYDSPSGDAEVYRLSTLRLYSPYLFSDGFESGLWPYDYVTGSVAIVTSPVHSGSHALECSASGSCVETHASGSTLFFDVWVYLDTLPTDYSGFQIMLASNSSYANIFSLDLLQFAGVYYLVLGYNYPSAGYDGYAFAVQSGAWYEVQLKYTQGASGGYTVWLNGIQVITVTGINTSNGSVAQIYFGRLWDDASGNLYIDDIKVSTSNISGEGS